MRGTIDAEKPGQGEYAVGFLRFIFNTDLLDKTRVEICDNNEMKYRVNITREAYRAGYDAGFAAGKAVGVDKTLEKLSDNILSLITHKD